MSTITSSISLRSRRCGTQHGEARVLRISCETLDSQSEVAIADRVCGWTRRTENLQRLIIDLSSITKAEDSCYWVSVVSTLRKHIIECLQQDLSISILGCEWMIEKISRSGRVGICVFGSLEDARQNVCSWTTLSPRDESNLCTCPHCGREFRLE